MTHRFDVLKQRCRNSWEAYCRHDFVRSLGAGDLAQPA